MIVQILCDALSIDFFFGGVLVGEGVGWVYFCYIILFVEGIANKKEEVCVCCLLILWNLR